MLTFPSHYLHSPSPLKDKSSTLPLSSATLTRGGFGWSGTGTRLSIGLVRVPSLVSAFVFAASQLGIALCYGRAVARRSIPLVLTAGAASSTCRYLESVQRDPRRLACMRQENGKDRQQAEIETEPESVSF